MPVAPEITPMKHRHSPLQDYSRTLDVSPEMRKRSFARRPQLSPTMRVEIGELAHNSRVVRVPGADDWFGEVEISEFITAVNVDAKVGDATRVRLDCIRVQATTELGERVLVREVTPARWARIHRLRLFFWRFSRPLRRRRIDVTTYGQRARILRPVEGT